MAQTLFRGSRSLSISFFPARREVFAGRCNTNPVRMAYLSERKDARSTARHGPRSPPDDTGIRRFGIATKVLLRAPLKLILQ